MRPKIRTLKGTDFWVAVDGTKNGNSGSFTIPAFARRFPLLRLDVDVLQPSFLQIEEEPKVDKDGWPSGRYGWFKLLYPSLVASEKKDGCASPAVFELSPYKAAVSYTRTSFTDEFRRKAQAEYLSNPRYRLHIDASHLDLCLTPAPSKPDKTDQG
mgnify:CR=1 FL=1